MSKFGHGVTNQHNLRRAFWEAHPSADRKRITDYAGTGKMYRTDTRVTWCDYIDMLNRSGHISSELAQRATLEP